METRFGLTRIEIDAVHLDRGLSEVEEADWRIAVQRSYRELHRALGRGESVVWDSASLTRAERDRIRATGERLGVEVLLIYVATADDERQQRRLENLVSGERIDVPELHFEAARQAFEIPGADERPIRYSGEQPVAEWLEMVIAPLIEAAEVERQA